MSRIIGKFIKVRRTELGLSQSSVARSLGYNTSQYISNIERGLASIPFAKIQDMSRLLKVDYRHLLNLKLMEEVPGFKKEFLAPAAPAAAPDLDMVAVPVMTTELCASWTDLDDLDFPRKMSSRFEYARTRDATAFFFEAEFPDRLSLAGIRQGDLLLIEPASTAVRGSIVLNLRGIAFRLGRLMPRNGEVILQPLDPDLEVEIFPRRAMHLFPVTELKRRLALEPN
ncbi:MAG: helix-turn-helix domain-containing protein [Acidobacteriota bacterium]